ncbi:MAG: ABC transporter permease [bacterium]
MAERGQLVWLGRITTRRRLLASSAALGSPAIGWMVLLLIVPSVVIAVLAFASRAPDGQVVWTLGLQNFVRLAGYGLLGWTPDYLWIGVRSVWVATVTTALCVALSYPLAFFIAAQPPARQRLCLAGVVIPMCVNLVVRTYAWELLLSPQLPLARLAAALGLIDEGAGLYPSGLAVQLGMVSTSLPFAVLPLVVNIQRLDRALIEAARDLYAGPVRVFRQAVLPQTWPGLGAAVVLTFVPAMGMFVISDRLGGSNFMLVGNLIQQQFGSSRDYPFGAAVSLTLIVLTLVGLVLYRRSGRGIELA